MSHHIHLLPGLIPVERPVKLNKKRRLRKTRSGEVLAIQDVGEISEIDEFNLGEDEEGQAISLNAAEGDTGAPALSWFSTSTMQTLLHVQEDK